jgi:hypothetical protein
MATNDKRAVYTMGALAASAILLALVTHASHKPEPRKDAPVRWVGTAPSQTAISATRQDGPSQSSASPRGSEDAQRSSTQPAARPANQPARPSDDASSSGYSSSSSTLPSFSTSLDGEEVSPPDSVAAPQETAAQRVARHLRRR